MKNKDNLVNRNIGINSSLINLFEIKRIKNKSERRKFWRPLFKRPLNFLRKICLIFFLPKHIVNFVTKFLSFFYHNVVGGLDVLLFHL